MRILIADDHAVVRKGLVQIVSETSDLTVVAEAGDGNEVIDLVDQQPVDVVVLDLNMPGPGGLQVLKHLQATHPDLPVLVLSMHGEDQYGVRVMRAGASGYLTKESAPEQLVQAIRRVGSGRRFVSPGVAEALLSALEGPTDGPPHTALSDREFDVMLRLSKGQTVTEIADALSLSVKTISTYRSRVLDKMHMSTNADLTQYALTNELM